MSETREARLELETIAAGLRFGATLDNGVAFTMDSGKGVAHASPVEMVLAAVAACTAMDVIAILRKKRQAVVGYEVTARGTRREEHPRIFTRIEVTHRLRGTGLSAVAIEEALRLSETKYCSVNAMLEKTVAIVHRYEIVPA